MHIEYDTTPEEFADAHLRLQARSKMARRTRWQATAWVAVLTGLLLYLLLTLRGASPTERATVAALGSVLAAGSYEPLQPWSDRNPLIGLMGPMMLQWGCILMGVVGLIWFFMRDSCAGRQ